MKILLINNSELTLINNDLFIENSTGLFARELKHLGHEINFFGQMLTTSGNTIHHFGIKENGMQVSGLKRKKNKLFNYILLYSSSIPQILKSDFIYIFYPSSFKYIAFLCVLFNKKYGLYVRGMDDLRSISSRMIYRKSYCIFTVSDYFSSYINEKTRSKPAETIRPMIAFTEKDIVENRQFNLKTAKDKFNILYIGRLTNDKGIIELLLAAKELVQDGYNFTINLLGNGEYKEQITNLINELNLSEYVITHDPVFDNKRIREFYLDADIFVIASYHEGFPRTLYEAMIFGTPIITSFVGGIPDVMEADYNCLRVEPKSAKNLKEKLVFAFNNYGTMVDFSKNATQTVKEILSKRKLSHAQALSRKIEKLSSN